MKFILPDFTAGKILVFGDVMLDRYWSGVTQRISPEAPVPVVTVDQQIEQPGGAGNVALNLGTLGVQTQLMGWVGDDAAADILEKKLKAVEIKTLFYRDAQNPTITKLRILSQNQQLIRMDFENTFKLQAINPLLDFYKQAITQANVVVLSDYGKGTLSNCVELINIAKEQHKKVLVDPKGRDFTIYRGATMLTPNLREFETIVGECHSEAELLEKAQQLMRDLNLEALLITRGSKGMTLLRLNQAELHLPAQSREVYDVTGAGDTVIATLAAALSVGVDIAMAVALANRAASIVVGKLGAATVSVAELRRSLLQDNNTNKGVMTEEQLLIAVEDAKAHGERVVMTNGCFDILHAGHVSYLENAKSLGDRLIVAVNDDASVAKLKGANRPINSLERRMSVLVGLASVDWVVPFSEPTPARLINTILPNILVKGGDYKPNEIAGADAVIANGGEVKVLNFVDGCSTTSMLEKIKLETHS